MHIAQVCNIIREKCPHVQLIGLKLPYNYNQRSFLARLHNNDINVMQLRFKGAAKWKFFIPSLTAQGLFLLLDFHHNAKEFSFRFHHVQQKNKYVQAEVLRRKAFVDDNQVPPRPLENEYSEEKQEYAEVSEGAAGKESKPNEVVAARKKYSKLSFSANEFFPNNKRHALTTDKVEYMD